MSILNNSLLLGAPAGATTYQVSRSLRFNGAVDSSYLSRTPASAGNRRTWTWSAWVKLAALSSGQNVIFSATDGSTPFAISAQSSGQILFGNLSFAWKETTAVFRDYSAWYHFCVAVDTNQASNANRLRFYVNGIEQTAFSTNRDLYLNTDLAINGQFAHEIGRYSAASNQHFNGYLAECHFIDGSAKVPGDFAETDSTTGQWIPRLYSGSYGSQGWKLTFADNSAATAAALGKDVAGSNNWTPNNFSVTAGAGNDSLVDTPTSYGTDARNGGEVRGNYCTWNPLDQSGITFSNGNLDTTGGGICRATFGLASGKWYWEQTVITKSDGANNPRGGVATASASLTNDLGAAATQWVMFMAGGSNGGKGYNASTITGSGSAFSVNDVAMFAYDADAGKLWFGRNGTWITGDPAAGTSPFYSSVTAPVFPVAQEGSSSSVVNYGQRAFSYQAPSGFKALVDTNLTAPVVAKPDQVMGVVLRTGTGTSGGTISSLKFAPDLIWTKLRSTASDHYLIDTVRGLPYTLSSNNTNTENNYPTWFTSTSSTGYTVGSYDWNSGTSVVEWCWDAGSSTVTNTQGSINSQVRANISAGFSICSWTAPSSGNFTWGHGLGVEPYMVIIKTRASSGYNWRVYHKSIITTVYENIDLNSTGAKFTSGTNMWGAALPTSTVVGSTANNTVGANDASIAYCFAPVAGYSSMGSYVGNGSTDGPFVFCGFRPKLVLARCSSGVADWWMYDSVRGAYNVNNAGLRPNSSNAETSDAQFDFLSNGFKIRTSGTDLNSNGGTHIFCAWAESPFQYARAR